jgi:hypothetical protein
LVHLLAVGARQREPEIEKGSEPESQFAEIPSQNMPDIFPEEQAKCHLNI